MLQRHGLGEAMACDVALRNGVPGAMLDGDACLITDGFEAHFDLGRLLGREARLPPREDQTPARFPNRDASDIPRSRGMDALAVFVDCERCIPRVIEAKRITDQQVMRLHAIHLLDFSLIYP
jgi:hypothetical protein